MLYSSIPYPARARARRAPRPGRGRRRAVAAAVLAFGVVTLTPGSTAQETGSAPGAERRAGVLELGGEPWRLRVGDDPAWAGVAVDESQWRREILPSTWRELGLTGIDGPLWLRREVRLPVAWRRDLAPSGLAVSVGPAAHGSYRLYVGGQEVGAHRPGMRLPRPETRVFDVPREAVGPRGRLQLALRFDRVAWRSDPAAGAPAPVASVAVGDRRTLATAVELEALRLHRQRQVPRLLGGLLLALGLFHLGLYAFRRDDHDLAWLGAAALGSSAVALFSTPWDALPWLGAEDRVQAVAVHLTAGAVIEATVRVLGRRPDLWTRRYQWSNVGLAVVLAVAPLRVFEAATPVRWLWLVPFFLGLGYHLALEVWRGNRDARLLAVGGAGLVISGLAETVLSIGRLGTTHPLPLWALALFLGGAALVQWSRHGRVQEELVGLRHQLERMVEDRTTELTHANQRLQAEISERQLAEEAMRMLERAVEQSVDGIAVVGLEGEMQFMNEAWARMHGYEPFELLGYDLNIFHTPEQMRDQVRPLMNRVRREGAQEAEIEHRRRGGDSFPAWQTATFLHDGEGEPVGYVFIARDITERKRAEEERLRLEGRVQQAEKLESLGSLAGGIAHDYNNILTSVLGNTSLALQELAGEHPARAPLEQIEASAERAAGLTDQLLAYAGEEQHVARVISLNELIEEHRGALEEAVSADARLDVHLKRDLPPVEVDPRQMRQVLVNLLANASDSLSDGRGLVMLRTGVVKGKRGYFDGAVLQPEREGPGPFVFFEVSDDGRGMDEDTRTKMFDPFFSTKASGRGLGLAAVLGIVRAHGGAIKVYSQPDRGTTVEVAFRAAADAAKVPPEQESGSVQAWEATGVALVVDDEQMVREVAARVLQRQGFDVLTAADGRQALEIFAQHQDEIRLVLLDHTMPGMDGEAVLQALEGFDSPARVVLMSGYREQNVMPEEKIERLAGFLHKPFRPNDLLRKVREVLDPDAIPKRRA